jgi:hypothetical protein
MISCWSSKACSCIACKDWTPLLTAAAYLKHCISFICLNPGRFVPNPVRPGSFCPHLLIVL